MAAAAQSKFMYNANVASMTMARAAMLHVSSKAKITANDFLPFPQDSKSSGTHLQPSTIEVLRRLIKNNVMPPRVEMAARNTLGGLLDG